MVKRKLLRKLPQKGPVSKSRTADAKRRARAPGKRTSAKNKVYWETRHNRSDVKRKSKR